MFDCFMMNEELDLCEIRFNTLAPVVEKFVVVESKVTHSGKIKGLHFATNRERFKEFDDKIIYIEYINNGNPDPWYHENAQRNVILDALKIQAPKDSLLFISDADEIPKPESLLEATEVHNRYGFPVSFIMSDSLYFMNFVADKTMKGPYLYNPFTAEAVHKNWIWEGKPIAHDPSSIRWHVGCLKPEYENDFPKVYNSGWHFSSLGGILALQRKIESCAHTEFTIDEMKSEQNLLKCITQGRAYYEDWHNFHGEARKYLKQPIDFLPEYVKNNISKFDKYIL